MLQLRKQSLEKVKIIWQDHTGSSTVVSRFKSNSMWLLFHNLKKKWHTHSLKSWKYWRAFKWRMLFVILLYPHPLPQLTPQRQTLWTLVAVSSDLHISKLIAIIWFIDFTHYLLIPYCARWGLNSVLSSLPFFQYHEFWLNQHSVLIIYYGWAK